ncbi:PepSY-associated transmembrane protein [Tahibacter aquaticus]|jgi:uncharacterized iron-regulated membrane protein|uniref:PepSY-associated transmembrane protein n=2 Tax=Tahibacter aquaticus TaxID=520092 RepID=A0A4R6YTP2_9GAMM|nr:PepSY-associated transmembrane protein [Tahibacter aquaticus]
MNSRLKPGIVRNRTPPKLFRMRAGYLNRKVHYWLSVWLALPMALISVTGLLLQFKKSLPWVQPPEQKRELALPIAEWPVLLAAAQASPQLGVSSWKDVERLELRPSKGLIKLIGKNGQEAQFDAGSGQLLQVELRRSDTIEALHDGSWFGDGIKFGWFATSAFGLLLATLSGIWLFVEPYVMKARRRRRQARESALTLAS